MERKKKNNIFLFKILFLNKSMFDIFTEINIRFYDFIYIYI